MSKQCDHSLAKCRDSEHRSFPESVQCPTIASHESQFVQKKAAEENLKSASILPLRWVCLSPHENVVRFSILGNWVARSKFQSTIEIQLQMEI